MLKKRILYFILLIMTGEVWNNENYSDAGYTNGSQIISYVSCSALVSTNTNVCLERCSVQQ